MSAERVWKKPEGAAASIEFIRPSRLTTEDNGNVLVEGTFIESLPNSFDNSKLDFKFENDLGNTIIINGAGNLGYRMRNVNPGQIVRVTYEGKQEIMSGKMKGRQAHNFDVEIGE